MASSRVLFAISGATSLASSAYLFRDLADLSQWVIRADRHDVFETFRNRHKIASVTLGSMAANTFVTFGMKPKMISIPVWAAVNGASAFLLYSGYVNPEVMMRPRNHNAVFVPATKVLEQLKREETVIVTNGVDGKALAFPDSQVLRPHVVRLPGSKPDGSQLTMTYCGLTNLGMVYEIPRREDGSEVELVPLTQLENNLILLDKKSGHIGQQINGVDETSLLAKIGGDTYHETKRRPSEKLLKEAKLHASEAPKEVPTWRMTLGNFVRTYPEGDVFLNDYKMFKDAKKPVKSIYDTLMDWIFESSVYFQATNPNPVFPSLEHIDPRLPSKEQVWAFNHGDDYVALTENFIRDGNNGIRNMKVGGKSFVASWDSDANTLGIFENPTSKSIKQNVNVHGEVQGKSNLKLERVSTVKNGVFWCVFATFFPDVKVNPES